MILVCPWFPDKPTFSQGRRLSWWLERSWGPGIQVCRKSYQEGHGSETPASASCLVARRCLGFLPTTKASGSRFHFFRCGLMANLSAISLCKGWYLVDAVDGCEIIRARTKLKPWLKPLFEPERQPPSPKCSLGCAEFRFQAKTKRWRRSRAKLLDFLSLVGFKLAIFGWSFSLGSFLC